jgi:hypothetical protein
MGSSPRRRWAATPTIGRARPTAAMGTSTVATPVTADRSSPGRRWRARRLSEKSPRAHRRHGNAVPASHQGRGGGAPPVMAGRPGAGPRPAGRAAARRPHPEDLAFLTWANSRILPAVRAAGAPNAWRRRAMAWVGGASRLRLSVAPGVDAGDLLGRERRIQRHRYARHGVGLTGPDPADPTSTKTSGVRPVCETSPKAPTA